MRLHMFATGILLVSAAAAAEPGFTPLFDGKTLNGWQAVDSRGTQWLVQDGVLVCPTGCRGKLLTTGEYRDFILRLEYKMAEPACNNGVNIRAPLEGRPAYAGMEIQILDDDNPKWKDVKPAQRTGSVYDVIPARTGFERKVGEWNEMEITARGRQIAVKLNGTVVLDASLDSVKDPEVLARHPGLARASGHVGFLPHNTRTEFRNIRIRSLP